MLRAMSHLPVVLFITAVISYRCCHSETGTIIEASCVASGYRGDVLRGDLQ
ncbi:Hypothetical protein, putative [Bodo saltans]|uniref:Membrane-associated protein n=1 Tax=Bodo saltans TaxID=75058 RepID=A0A0S4IJK3_BODSA|nr:Hypothetical protein, putative [Bodo saltans]|eukprot:CUE88867.1 Hypothetical protein, putative [Bodo saltans]